MVERSDGYLRHNGRLTLLVSFNYVSVHQRVQDFDHGITIAMVQFASVSVRFRMARWSCLIVIYCVGGPSVGAPVKCAGGPV